MDALHWLLVLSGVSGCALAAVSVLCGVFVWLSLYGVRSVRVQ